MLMLFFLTTLIAIFLLSKIAVDMDAVIEDIDSLRDVLINYRVINEQVGRGGMCILVRRGSSMSLLILHCLIHPVFEMSKDSAVCKNPAHYITLSQTHSDLIVPNDLQNQI